MSKGTVNKVTLLGRLGADPEMRAVSSGGAVTNLRIATNSGYKDKNTGKFVETTEWHRVVLFNRLAEIAGQYLQTGRSVYIEGRIRTSKWQDQAGQDRYTTEIIANEMQLIGGREEQREDEASPFDDAPTVATPGAEDGFDTTF
ncbi:MAG: single-stranded DNA-binding protein [Thiotrichaceae bacterium]|nr:single-stranded DNA-binding protein [Thiotrichaceae bacterium]